MKHNSSLRHISMTDSISGYLFEKWRPVQQLYLLKYDALVVRGNNDQLIEDARGSDPGLKSAITEFTPKSWSNLLFLVRNTYMIFSSLLTLTYPAEFPLRGSDSKAHLDAFLWQIRKRWRFVAYIWFLEFQKRGAPHYHILLTIDLSYYGLITRSRKRRDKWTYFYTNQELHDWCSQTWSRIVYSSARWKVSTADQEKHIAAGCSWEQLMLQDAAIRYTAKHFSKASQKEVPPDFVNVGRFWGASRSVREAINQVGSLNTTAAKLEESLKSLNWFGFACYEKLGYWPRVLFGAGELVIQNPDVFGFTLEGVDYLAWLEEFLDDEED